MIPTRSPLHLVVSALGAAVLAVSVFMPWYALNAGIAVRTGGSAAPGPGIDSVQQIATVDGQHAFRYAAVILLVLAGLALLDALVPLAGRGAAVGDGAGGAVGLLGLLAAAAVLYRLVDPPAIGAAQVTVTMREGGWIALLGAATMILAGLAPRRGAVASRSTPHRVASPSA